MTDGAPAPASEARVSIADGPLVGAVLGRVVGMLAARAQCPIDRLDDALLITDAVAAHGARFSADGRVNVSVRANGGSLVLTVAGLAPAGAEGLIEDADLPGVGNVLERVADELERGTSEAGELLRIHLTFAR